MFISLITFNVHAQTDLSNGYETEKNFLDQIYITEGIEKKPDEIISRAEFTAMVVRIMNSNIPVPANSNFTDCKYSAFIDEIKLAEYLGITNGTSKTTFSPDDGVAAGVAAKMLIAVLDYNTYAEVLGGYPSGYLSLSSKLGLFKGVSQNSALTVKDAYTLIYNTLLADKAIFTGVKNGDVIMESVDGKNLLTENFGLTHISGIVNAAGFYSLSDEYIGKNKIEVNGKIFNVLFDASEYFGLCANIWYSEKDDTVKIISPDSSNRIITIEAKNISGFSSNVLNVYDEIGNEKKYNIERELSFVLNGRVIAHSDGSFTFDEGNITIIDNDGDGKYELALAQKKEYFVIQNINPADKVIHDANSVHKRLYLEEDVDKYCKIEIDGKEASFDELKKNMVLEVLKSTDSSSLYIKSTSLPQLKGVVTEIADDMLYIDGKPYRVNSYFKNNSIQASLGSSYSFLLAPDMSITTVLDEKNANISYGYFLNFGIKGGIDSKTEIKLLTSENSIEIYELSDKITFNDIKDVKKDDITIKNMLLSGDKPVYQLVRYKLSNGKISMLDTQNDSSLSLWSSHLTYPENNSLTRFVDKQSVWYSGSAKFGVPNVSFLNASVFVVPETAETQVGTVYDDELFFADGLSSLEHEETYTVSAYDYDKNYLPGAIVVFENKENPDIPLTPSNSATSYIVTAVNDAVDTESEPVKIVKVYGNGEYREYYMRLGVYQNLVNAGKNPGIGDIIRISTDASGYIRGLALDVDYNEQTKTASIEYISMMNSYARALTYFGGFPVSQTDGHLLINATHCPTDTVTDNGLLNLTTSSAKYTVYDRKTGQARAGNSGNIICSENTSEASMIFARASYYNINHVFIYVN